MNLFKILQLPDEAATTQETRPPLVIPPKIQPPRQVHRQRDDIKTYSNGKSYKKSDNHECEWNLTKNNNDNEYRSSDLVEKDFQDIRAHGLKVNVAISLKELWSAGASIGEVVKQKRGERFYSRRNIEKYWAIFNRNSPPSV